MILSFLALVSLNRALLFVFHHLTLKNVIKYALNVKRDSFIYMYVLGMYTSCHFLLLQILSCS